MHVRVRLRARAYLHTGKVPRALARARKQRRSAKRLDKHLREFRQRWMLECVYKPAVYTRLRTVNILFVGRSCRFDPPAQNGIEIALSLPLSQPSSNISNRESNNVLSC